jgi:hypothetical protein
MISPSLPSACGLRRGASGGSLYPSRNGSFLPSAEAGLLAGRRRTARFEEGVEVWVSFSRRAWAALRLTKVTLTSTTALARWRTPPEARHDRRSEPVPDYRASFRRFAQGETEPLLAESISARNSCQPFRALSSQAFRTWNIT